ncbi:hypothetical protein HELRODRAFT_170531 [Helobdella robusta]|uniref:Charged multivesicular body protein 3 n=1 Tax=Helobdella robusta TaxID=6412 RepID=T1F360_HELRO|nr:hypothetical protein HELRODRAFT_170531 [Helobdella robusta]ESO07218.1 hypothetical protein HELRODRAFT_170531 [Helobdella robusta]
MGLFGKQKDPKELVREWQASLRKESRLLDRQILGIQREQEKVKRALKMSAKKGEKDSCKVLAKEIVQSNKAISRIHCAKANIKSVEMHMNQQLSTLRLSGAIQKSVEVMKSMQQLIKVQDIAGTMRDMSKEMMKAGIIEEMIDDVMEADDTEEMEEEVEKEVDKVLWEITAGQIGNAPDIVKDPLPSNKNKVKQTAEEVDEEDDEVIKMQARLQALKS